MSASSSVKMNHYFGFSKMHSSDLGSLQIDAIGGDPTEFTCHHPPESDLQRVPNEGIILKE